MPIQLVLNSSKSRKNKLTGLMMGLLIVLMVLNIHVANVSGAQTAGAKSFEKGIAAFQAGRFKLALTHFKAAGREGVNTVGLHYNLGVCYYKLKRYEEAQREFAILTRAPGSAPLAHYNLGLIALQRHQPREAMTQFQIARQTARNEKLRSLAAAQLALLKKETPPKRYAGILSVGGGYDDNVGLVSDDNTQYSKEADPFLELYAALRSQLSGTRQKGVQLRLMGYAADYLDVNEYDFMNFGIAPEIDRHWGKWQTSLAGNFNFLLLDRSSFENMYGLEVSGNRPFSHHLNLNVDYTLDFIDGASEYNYLSGQRHRISIQAYAAFPKTVPAIGYTLELNNRNDDTYPLRHEIFVSVKQQLVDHLVGFVRGDYRYSRFQQVERRDERFRASGGLYYQINKAVQGNGRYTYTKNTSNIILDDYTSNTFSLSMEYLF